MSEALTPKLDKIHIECACGGHILSAMRDEDDGSVYFSMYTYGGSEKLGFRRRIKAALRLLRTGRMFSDQAILTEEEQEKLKLFL